VAGEWANSSPVGLWSENWGNPDGRYRNIRSLSILVAALASYTALDLGGRVAAVRGLARRVWLAAAAITMGGGIWSMHFVAMLAFIMPTPMSYDIGLTTLSLVVAMFVTGGGFYVISRHSGSLLRLVLSGIFMGLGIAAMHYTGMAAMREHVDLSYDRIFVALSLIIAIGASTAALWLAFRTTDLGQKLIAAVVMGLAISGMHYTAMGGTTFAAHGPVFEVHGYASLDQTNLALAVAGTTFVILASALIASLSEQKRAEEALREVQADLAHVTRVTTLGEIAASIAHEVNQPLAAVVANAEACLRWLDRGTPDLDAARRSVEWIIDDANRASEVIRRVRALANKSDVEKAPLDINDVVKEVIALVQGELVSHRVSLRMEFANALPVVPADRVELQQVVINLVMNGIEAMQSVTERPRELLIRSLQDETQQVLVSVTDCGVGISAENADRLFNAFFTTKTNGMGMGLSICRSIIEAHGGRLWASANLPHGATFQFTLPVSANTAL
jgi:NO-binding membrane sensor protein with MHYT domain